MPEENIERSYTLEYVDECLFFTASYFYLMYRMLKVKKSSLKILSLAMLFVSASSLLLFFNILVYLTKYYDIDKIYLEKVGHLDGSHMVSGFDIIPIFNWCLSLSNSLKISALFLLNGSAFSIMYSLVRLPASVFLDLFLNAPEKTVVFYRSVMYGTEIYLVLLLFLMKRGKYRMLKMCLLGEGFFRFYVNIIDVPVEIGEVSLHVIKKIGLLLMVLSYMVIVEIGSFEEKKKAKSSDFSALDFADNDRNMDRNMIAFDDFPEEKMCLK